MKKFMSKDDGQTPGKNVIRVGNEKKKKKRELERGNVPAVSAVLVHVGGKNKSTPGKSKPYAPIGTIAALKEWNERLLLPVRDSKCHWIDTLGDDDDEKPKTLVVGFAASQSGSIQPRRDRRFGQPAFQPRHFIMTRPTVPARYSGPCTLNLGPVLP
ncbi:hypothetical protein BJX66DRAFT_337 [Aspergillus keveii]|uniref:Uncharacterized protein n=1 Tax=Aspergillus keveii TaxID=714993 RepID=A0ABR4GR34_9EURO